MKAAATAAAAATHSAGVSEVVPVKWHSSQMDQHVNL
jgi:hypothetical protein